ncbi:MAG: ABC transporter ATP-binding protein [Chloroflexi bacterium]|nr:ABC transporter ATP-binding protein [Chloroflexota bacterium]
MGDSNAAGAVEFAGVTKRIGNRDLVKDLTFAVGQGQIYGLIGPSGGGKTTTVRLMVGIYVPTEGEIGLWGTAPTRLSFKQRQQIGYMPQHFSPQPTLTAAENLSFVAGLYGIGWLRHRKLIPNLLRQMEIWEARNRLAKDSRAAGCPKPCRSCGRPTTSSRSAETANARSGWLPARTTVPWSGLYKQCAAGASR